ncbi:MAG: hydroxyacid dehydrogenase [Leptolyngbya foveolarum]|uniref:Hydroxyacid dehydrogenase n=1 Tax=Leptolyngbya foveolarum TaxID=47253 RepID=A0A2W4UPH7_9CYAN|nr:MAG: hydroxyacid dehydrogenase [Leptolyngbya foveolarum]
MKVGILGIGLMGGPMALKLQADGFEVMAWNRTLKKLTPLREAGIETTEVAGGAIAACDVTITMLSDAAATESALFADASALAERTILQMATIAPEESRLLKQQVEAAGGTYLEAPVLGSTPEVKDGSLIVMVGATPEQFEQWMPVFKCFGVEPQLMGPVGTAAATKLAMNQLIGTLTSAFSMSLGLVQREGLDLEKFMTLVRASALYAPQFDKKLGRMCDRNFEDPNFPTKHLLKDMNLFVQAAENKDIDARVAAGVSAIAQKAISQGLANKDYSSIYSAVNPD